MITICYLSSATLSKALHQLSFISQAYYDQHDIPKEVYASVYVLDLNHDSYLCSTIIDNPIPTQYHSIYMK